MNPDFCAGAVLLMASAGVLAQSAILYGDWLMGHQQHERPRSRGAMLFAMGVAMFLAGAALVR